MCAYPCSRPKSYMRLSILRLEMNKFQNESQRQTTVLKSNRVVVLSQPVPLTDVSPSSSEQGYDVTRCAPTSTLAQGRAEQPGLWGYVFSNSVPYIHPLLYLIAGRQSSCKDFRLLSTTKARGRAPWVASSQDNLRQFKWKSQPTHFSSILSAQGSLGASGRHAGTWAHLRTVSFSAHLLVPSLTADQPLPSSQASRVNSSHDFRDRLGVEHIPFPSAQERGQVYRA